MNISRRSFLTTASGTAAVVLSQGVAGQLSGTSTTSMQPGPGNKWPGRVAINFNKKAVSDSGKVDTVIVAKMVDDLIMLLTDKSDAGSAWKEVFPSSLSLQSTIAIKINTANTGKPCPHWASVRAVVDGLLKMDFNGTKFPSANITIYDMDFLKGMDSAGYTKTNFPDITLVYTKMVDGGDGATIHAKPTNGSAVMVENHEYSETLKNADYLINVFSPRGHTMPPDGSKFTLGFKSHVGTYSSHYLTEGPTLHEYIVENLREMNCTGPVYKKTVVSFCSGLFGMNEGNGPGGSAENYPKYAKSMDASITLDNVPPTTFMLSTDPVAIEMQTIKMMRINNGGKYTTNDMPPYLQASAGISGKVTGTTYNIGIIDEAAMDIRRVINEVTAVERARQAHVTSDIAVSTIRGQHMTFIEFRIPERQSARTVTIEVATLDGRLLHQQRVSVGGMVNHYSWNNRDSHGTVVGNGTYVVRILADTLNLARHFTIIH